MSKSQDHNEFINSGVLTDEIQSTTTPVSSFKDSDNGLLDILKASYHSSRLVSQAYSYALFFKNAHIDTALSNILAKELGVYISKEGLLGQTTGVISKFITNYPAAQTCYLIAWSIAAYPQGFENSKKYIKKIICRLNKNNDITETELDEIISLAEISLDAKKEVGNEVSGENHSNPENDIQQKTKSVNIEQARVNTSVDEDSAYSHIDEIINDFEIITCSHDKIDTDTKTNYSPSIKAAIYGGYLLSVPVLLYMGGPVTPIIYLLSSDVVSEGIERIASKYYNSSAPDDATDNISLTSNDLPTAKAENPKQAEHQVLRDYNEESQLAVTKIGEISEDDFVFIT